MTKYILGLDPGFAKFGLCLTDTELNLKEFVIIKTKKAANKKFSEDLFDRGQEVARKLLEILESYREDTVLICAEAFSFPPHARAASQMAITWGVVCLLSEELKVPMAMKSPQDIKKCLCGTSKASKNDIKEALEARGYVFPKLNKTDYEHPCDALAAIIACENTQIFRAATRN